VTSSRTLVHQETAAAAVELTCFRILNRSKKPSRNLTSLRLKKRRR